jgi:hypothetical protein
MTTKQFGQAILAVSTTSARRPRLEALRMVTP